MGYEDNNLCNRGFDALISVLGVVEAERFIMLMNREAGDYTEWRRAHLFQDETLESLAEKARQTGREYHQMHDLAKAV